MSYIMATELDAYDIGLTGSSSSGSYIINPSCIVGNATTGTSLVISSPFSTTRGCIDVNSGTYLTGNTMTVSSGTMCTFSWLGFNNAKGYKVTITGTDEEYYYSGNTVTLKVQANITVDAITTADDFDFGNELYYIGNSTNSTCNISWSACTKYLGSTEGGNFMLIDTSNGTTLTTSGSNANIANGTSIMFGWSGGSSTGSSDVQLVVLRDVTNDKLFYIYPKYNNNYFYFNIKCNVEVVAVYTVLYGYITDTTVSKGTTIPLSGEDYTSFLTNIVSNRLCTKAKAESLNCTVATNAYNYTSLSLIVRLVDLSAVIYSPLLSFTLLVNGTEGTSYSGVIGNTATLSLRFNPEDASARITSWTSSDTGVCTINEDGVITLIAAGTATVYATIGGDLGTGVASTAVFTITSAEPVTVLNVSISPYNVYIYVGGSWEFEKTVYPSNADPAVTWSSSSTSVATIDSNGTATGLRVGSTNIRVTSVSNTSKYDTAYLTVKSRSTTNDSSLITCTGSGTYSFSSNDTYPWVYNTDTSRFESTIQGMNNKTSTRTITFNLSSTSTISFNYGTDSETNYDKLKITLDGVDILLDISGLDVSNSYTSSVLSTGSHTLRLEYSKDTSYAKGADLAYISNLCVADAVDEIITLNIQNDPFVDNNSVITLNGTSNLGSTLTWSCTGAGTILHALVGSERQYYLTATTSGEIEDVTVRATSSLGNYEEKTYTIVDPLIYNYSALDSSYLSNYNSIIGTGTTANYTNSPFVPYYKYSTFQTIYLASDIAKSGQITSLYYYVGTASSVTGTVYIYLNHTSNSTFTSTSAPLSKGTLVYSGSITAFKSTGWEEIILQYLFDYNGVDNLLVTVCFSLTTATSTTPKMRYSSAGSGVYRAAYARNSSTASYGGTSYNGTMTRTINYPNIKIEFNEYVDLGLTSGTLWGMYNMYGTTANPQGGYFSLGCVRPMDTAGDTVPYHNFLTADELNAVYHGSNSIPNTKDVAYLVYAGNARMPYTSEYLELFNECTASTVTSNEVTYLRLTGPNGCYIDIPQTSYYKEGSESTTSNHILFRCKDLQGTAYSMLLSTETSEHIAASTGSLGMGTTTISIVANLINQTVKNETAIPIRSVIPG